MESKPDTHALKSQPGVNERLLNMLRWVLPMAKGYAAKNPVGANQEICNDAEELIRAAESEAPGENERLKQDELLTLLDKHHRLAAEAREMLYNNGHGPNLSQRKKIDAILYELAGLPIDARKTEGAK